MIHDVFWRIDENDNFESLVIRYNDDGSIYEIQYFDGDVGIIYEPQTGNYRTTGSDIYFEKKSGDRFLINLNTQWGLYTRSSEFYIRKTADIAEFYFFSDIRVKGIARRFDSGVAVSAGTFQGVLDELRNYKDWPWRVWRITDIDDTCNWINERTEEVVYDDSYLYSPDGRIKLLLSAANIAVIVANQYSAKLKLNIINQDKERAVKIRQHIQNQTAVKIQQDVCILEEPQAALKQHIDTEAKTVISESINQPVVKIKQELIYEYEAGAKFLIFVYIQFQRFRANLKISLQGENKAVLKQEITRVPEAKIVQHVDTPISVKISEDLTRIPEVKLKQHIDTEAKVKIKYLLTRIPKTTLKIKVRTYNRAPADYYDYYGIRTFGFLRS
ncbi:hypothetical protein [Persephonella sp.]